MATADEVVTILRAETAAHDQRINQSAQQFERNMQRMGQAGNRFERGVSGLSNRVSHSFSTMGVAVRSFAGAFAAGFSVQALNQLVETSIRVENSLKATGLAGVELTKVYEDLFQVAQKNAVPIETLTELYSRLALSQKELGVSQEELIGFTDTIAQALRAGGQSAQQASGALLQLSQALGGGVVRAEEFNSILEGAPTIVQAAAAGIAEAGGSVAKLRQLMIDGKVSSEAFFRGIEAGAPVIEQRLAGAEQTISQSLIRLRNVLVDAAGRFNESTNAAQTFGTAIEDVAAFVESINFDNIISEIQELNKWLNDSIQTWQEWAAAAGRAVGADRVGEAIVRAGQVATTGQAGVGPSFGGITSQRIIQDRVNDAFGNAVETAGALTEKAIQDAARRNGVVPATTAGGKTSRLPAAPAAVTPISLDDFPVGGEAGGTAGAKKIAAEAKRAADQLNNAIARQAGIAVDAATQLLGQNENTNTGTINAFLRRGGVDLNAATTAWCAAFVNSALAQVGVTGSGSNVATDFLNWGVKVDPSQIQRGDVLVDPNGRSAGQTGGHVGFATGQVRFEQGILQLQMLSGNASNEVQEDWVNASEVVARRATDAVQVSADALTNISDQSKAALEAQKNELKAQEEAYQQFGQIATTVINGITTALADGKIEGEELLQILLQVVQQLLTMPGGLGGLFGGGGGGGLLGGLIIPGILHDGGIAGKDGYGHGRAMRASTWAGARRMHGGGIAGLMPGEVPTLLQKGERVLTAAEQRGQSAGQRGGGQIEVIGTFEVKNGNLIPLVTGVSGVVSGQQIRAANKQLPNRIVSSQARGT